MGKTAQDAARPLIAAAWFAAILLPSSLALADPAAKVFLPTVVQGETEFELGGGYQKWRNSDSDRERQMVAEVGYGITSWWKSELGVGVTRLPGASTHLDEIEWENIFALTEPGQYWTDLGLFAEVARDHSGGRNLLVLGPILQKEFGRLQANLNVLLEKQLGSDPEPGVAINYAWQIKWRGNPRLEPGIQGFGTLGRSNDFARESEHRIGPALFSQVVIGARNKLRFDAALLFGLNRNSADTTLRFNLEYEVY